MSILPYEDEVICVLLDTYLWREFKASLAVRDIASDMVTRSWIVGRMPDETARQIHSSYGGGKGSASFRGSESGLKSQKFGRWKQDAPTSIF